MAVPTGKQIADFFEQMRHHYPLFRVAHKKPCKECPFRTCHLAGWLGPDPLEAYMVSINQELPISCHMTRGKRKEPAQCAGSAIHYRNQLKVPRHDDFAAVIEQYAKDKAVFRWPQEFEAHHKGGVVMQIKQSKQRVRQ